MAILDRTHEQERYAAGAEHAVGYAAERPTSQAGPAVGTHGDQVHLVGLGIIDDPTR
jgi:hypothetical protein